MKRKLIAGLTAAAAVMTMASAPAMAATPAIQKTVYEGSGVVEVDFKRDVQYKNAKVLVKDSSGKYYTATITDRDDDDMTFKVKNIAAGKTYAYQISGVRSGRSGSYVKITGRFTVPAAKKLSIKSVDSDVGDRELELDFSGKVQYKNAKVKVKDAAGKYYTAKITDKDSDSVEIYVKGLKKGKKYAVQISGVRLKNNGSYVAVSKTFTAR